jgi:hypothetical protein
MHGIDSDGAQPVDLEGIPRPKGFVFYGSTKIERNSKSVNVSATASVSYRPPEGELLRDSIEKHRQVHQEVLRCVWFNAEARKIAAETGSDVPFSEPEHDFINPPDEEYGF